MELTDIKSPFHELLSQFDIHGEEADLVIAALLGGKVREVPVMSAIEHELNNVVSTDWRHRGGSL